MIKRVNETSTQADIGYVAFSGATLPMSIALMQSRTRSSIQLPQLTDVHSFQPSS